MRHHPHSRFTLAAALCLAPLAANACASAPAEPERAEVVLSADPQPAPETAEAAATAPPDEAYEWLEEVDGERALAWVRAQNAATAERLESHPLFPELHRQALATLNSESRLPDVTWRGAWLYNFWKDEEHPRGIYRRTTLEGLRGGDPRWEVVLDVDALAAAEEVPWVFHDMTCLPPEHRHCLVDLSPGGGDAGEIREFDAEKVAFVADGFHIPTAKTSVSWIDRDTLFVGTEMGEGSLTDSGYPRQARRWKRGTPLAESELIYEGPTSSVSAGAYRLRSSGQPVDLVYDGVSFWTNERWQIVDGEPVKLELPPTAVIEDAVAGRLLISLKEDWQRDGRTLASGSVLVADPAALRGGEGSVEVLVDPAEGAVVEDVTAAEDAVLVTLLDEVRGRLRRYVRSAGGAWQAQEVPFPDHGALSVVTTRDGTGDALVEYESFLVPPTLYHVPAAGGAPEVVARQEPTFDATGFAVTQHWATSADGTRVPYYQVARKGLELDGENPTHIFSYGGFRNALVPAYSGSYEQLHGAYGKMWLERGGVFVLANIRGGGEFGPAWHQAALLHHRHRSFEDFEAVAADLIARQVTAAEHLGIEGRSQGGLLVTTTMLRRPDLYGAVVAGVPLTDMRRYHRLLAGASWMAEYGDPDDPADWAYLRTYSPFHNVEPGQDYPEVFFFTSTRDDRVHPGHARKLAARMQDMGYEVWYYENIEGGHGGSVTNDQLAYRIALAYTHLWNQLAPPTEEAGS